MASTQQTVIVHFAQSGTNPPVVLVARGLSVHVRGSVYQPSVHALAGAMQIMATTEPVTDTDGVIVYRETEVGQ